MIAKDLKMRHTFSFTLSWSIPFCRGSHMSAERIFLSIWANDHGVTLELRPTKGQKSQVNCAFSVVFILASFPDHPILWDLQEGSCRLTLLTPASNAFTADYDLEGISSFELLKCLGCTPVTMATSYIFLCRWLTQGRAWVLVSELSAAELQACLLWLEESLLKQWMTSDKGQMRNTRTLTLRPCICCFLIQVSLRAFSSPSKVIWLT